jgi:enoyl-[acyl-carrier protein] reductase II
LAGHVDRGRRHLRRARHAAAFALSAEGIQMGSRFVSSAESPVRANYKLAIVDASETGAVMLNRKSTPCGRALRTERAKEIDCQGRLRPGDLWQRERRLYPSPARPSA